MAPPRLDEPAIHCHLKALFKRHGKGSQARALAQINMTPVAFRTARRRNKLRLSDLLGILDALGEDPIEFFQEITEEEDEDLLLSLNSQAFCRELSEIDELRFDAPAEALTRLSHYQEKVEPTAQIFAVAGSACRALELIDEARVLLRHGSKVSTTNEELGVCLQRLAWTYFLDRPQAAHRLIERSGYLFWESGLTSRAVTTIVDRSLVAYHSGRFETAALLARKSLRHKDLLSPRNIAAALQTAAMCAAKADDIAAARKLLDEATALEVPDSYSRGNLLWSYAQIENGKTSCSLFDSAIECFGSRLLFFAVCCGIDKARRFPETAEELLRKLIGLSEQPGNPRGYRKALWKAVRDSKIKREALALEEIEAAVRRVWDRWRTARKPLKIIHLE